MVEQTWMTRLIVFLTLWLGSCLYALWRGGAPERIGALIFLLAAICSAALQSQSQHFQAVEAGVLLVDCLVLLGFASLSIASERFWPLWMSGMQAVQVLSHAAIALNPHVLPWGYWKALTLWSYPMLGLLVVATWRHARRQGRGLAPSWKNFSPP